MKWVIIEKFRFYFYGYKFYVVIDSNFFIYLVTFVKLFVIDYRWFLSLVLFDFLIIYRVGKVYSDVDGFLRVLRILSLDVGIISDEDYVKFFLDRLFFFLGEVFYVCLSEVF